MPSKYENNALGNALSKWVIDQTKGLGVYDSKTVIVGGGAKLHVGEVLKPGAALSGTITVKRDGDGKIKVTVEGNLAALFAIELKFAEVGRIAPLNTEAGVNPRAEFTFQSPNDYVTKFGRALRAAPPIAFGLTNIVGAGLLAKDFLTDKYLRDTVSNTWKSLTSTNVGESHKVAASAEFFGKGSVGGSGGGEGNNDLEKRDS